MCYKKTMNLYYIADRIDPKLYSEYGYIKDLAYEVTSKYGSDEKFKVMIFSPNVTARKLQREFDLEHDKVARGRTPKIISSMIYRYLKVPLRAFSDGSIVHCFACPSIKTTRDVKRIFEPISIKKYTAPHLFNDQERLFTSIKDVSRCDVVIAHSRYMANELESKLFVNNERIRIIPRAVGVKLDKDHKVDIKLPDKYLVFAGRIERYKNLERLMRAFSAVTSKDVKLFITGDAKDKDYLKKLKKFSSQLCGERIVFTGYLPKQDLWKIMQNSMAVCEPSYINDFPETIIEAQALGTPVIASGIEAHRSVCEDTILYFDPLNEEDIKEAISSILDKKTSESLIKKGRANSALFSWEEIAPLYRDLYMSF